MSENNERESMEFDVVIVGAGPAGLAAAIRLVQLDANLSIVVVEKGSEIGAHILSGNVFEPTGLDELIPDWAEKGAPVAFFGGLGSTLDLAAEQLSARHPGLNVVLRLSPPMGFDPTGPAADAAIATIRDSGARLVFVALGAPKQEVFAARALAALPGVGFFSIGAGLDFVAPPLRLCTDNGPMVAWAGIERLGRGARDGLDFAPRPRWPLESLSQEARP